MSADELKRYEHGCISMYPDAVGEWCKHKDAAATISRLEAERDVALEQSEIRRDALERHMRAADETIQQLQSEIIPLRALFPTGPLHEQVAAVLDQLRTPKVTNEMKARFIGEFSWKEDAPYYDEDGDYHEHEAERVVPWDLCKKIYKEMAAFANAALQAGANSGESHDH